VLIAHCPGHLRIEVRNGPGRRLAGTNGSGHGLMGMRERVQLWGGSMEATPTDNGGFRLCVELPIGAKS
jgi:signal transduction histidine kinase